ncbi:hypothetical protein L7F22_020702 [Adiantum nelumboides]|nr:hypothetical protein [Adiantum nelumboides]
MDRTGKKKSIAVYEVGSARDLEKGPANAIIKGQPTYGILRRYPTQGAAASIEGRAANEYERGSQHTRKTQVLPRTLEKWSANPPELVTDILGSADADASSKLCRAWGQIRDQQSLVFFDPGARANFITPQLAEKMGIKTDEMGPTYTASMAAPEHEVAVTPLIGKLRLHIQGYVGHEEFYIMPLEGCDVLLGMPWFYNHKAVLDSFNKTVTLEIRGRKIVLDVKLKGESVPLVSASAVPRLMKQHISTYLIYVKERDEAKSSNLSSLDVSRRAFLNELEKVGH